MQKGYNESEISTGREEFQIITTALSQSQRHIRSFRISLPFLCFVDPTVTDFLVDHGTNAYSSLEELTLKLDYVNGTVSMSSMKQPLCALQAFLGSTRVLRCLRLTMPSHEWFMPALIDYRQVFPTDGTGLMRLTTLEIRGMGIRVKELVHLLTVKIPCLGELTLADINLLEGR